MKKTTYRLSEYRITEYDDGSLCWNSHFGFASEREGRCFLVGNILFFGPWMSEEAGFFKREFFDHLRNLPVWDKTEYFSPPVVIHSCTGDRKIPLETVRRSQKDKSSSLGTASSLQDTIGNISYRLNRYEITMRQGGQILWKTWGGPKNVKSGRGMIMEDILFLGSTAKVEIISKKDFLSYLKSLQVWENTRYYCRNFDLRSCKTGQALRLEKDVVSPTCEKTDFHSSQFLHKSANCGFRSRLASTIHSCRGRMIYIASTHLARC